MHRGSARWWITVVALPALVVFGVFLPLAAFFSRYPDPIAVHWGFSGPPNGDMSLPLYLVLLATGMLLAWAALAAGARHSMPSAPLASVTYFIMGLLASVNAQIVVANLDAVSWGEAASMAFVSIVVVIGAALLAAAAGWFLAGGSSGVEVDEPLAPIAPSSVPWSGSASNGWVMLIAAIPVFGVIFFDPVWLVLFVVIALVGVAFSSVTVDADEAGVTVKMGPFGWPTQRIAVGGITGVSAATVKPMSYGGWGYRVRSGVRAIIIRSGPAIRVERADQPDLLITVDDAPAGAAAIGALVSR
jgi:hypothetical protein